MPRAPSIASLASDPRVLVRRPGPPDPEGRCVVYWMQRAQRAVDNPALDVAVDAANALAQPVVALLAPVPFDPNANARHYHFLFQGVPDIATGLGARGVGLVFRPYPDHSLLRFCEEVRPSLVIGDENPVREAERWRVRAARRLAVPFWTVDADVVVPSRQLEREHVAARTFRQRIAEQLDRFLVAGPEPRARVPWRGRRGLFTAPPAPTLPESFRTDRSVAPVATARGGTAEAQGVLARFLAERLRGYARRRRQPDVAATSELSPYLHFGHLGPRAIALAVRAADAPRLDGDAFLEELIVRRELAVNFVRYNDSYDQLAGAEPWARRSLAAHERDRRDVIYTERQLESARTHDPLWNAAQRQMVRSGWMHGHLRMYWAKKILEWTPTPAQAYDLAVRLNDRYQLDGRDPSGYAGVACAIAGKHDRAWGPERPVYGLVRYMSFASTVRTFDSRSYVARWADGGP